MGVEVKDLNFRVVVRSPDKWTSADRIRAEIESEDWPINEMRELMRAVGLAYMELHPTIFTKIEPI